MDRFTFLEFFPGKDIVMSYIISKQKQGEAYIHALAVFMMPTLLLLYYFYSLPVFSEYSFRFFPKEEGIVLLFKVLYSVASDYPVIAILLASIGLFFLFLVLRLLLFIVLFFYSIVVNWHKVYIPYKDSVPFDGTLWLSFNKRGVSL